MWESAVHKSLLMCHTCSCVRIKSFTQEYLLPYFFNTIMGMVTLMTTLGLAFSVAQDMMFLQIYRLYHTMKVII
jgi:hypothetical protein